MKFLVDKFIKILSPLFNTRAAGLYILLFAAAVAVATFIENDYGTSAAQKVVYKSWWFELLLVLFGIAIIVNIFKFRMIQQKKWAVLLFHASIIIILIGAGLTRYIGFEGVMHIRENASANSFLSSNNYLKFEVLKDQNTYSFDEPVLFATLGNNNWEESYLVENDLIEIKVNELIANPTQVLNSTIDGKPTLKLVASGANGTEEYFITQGESYRIKNVVYNFKDKLIPGAINLKFRNDSLLFNYNTMVTQMTMSTRHIDTVYPSQQ